MTDGDLQNATYSRATVLELVDEYEQIEKGISDAKATVSSLVRGRTTFRKERIQAAGIPLEAFDAALIEAKMSGTERERLFAHKRRLLAFMGRPLGTQGSIFDETPEDQAAGKTHFLKRIDVEGFEAGKTEQDRYKSNTYSPGTEEHVRFDNAWLRGEEDRLKERPEPAAKTSRRRRATPDPEPEDISVSPARRHGLADGTEGHRNNADNYPQDSEEHAEYELAHAEASRAREGATTH